MSRPGAKEDGRRRALKEPEGPERRNERTKGPSIGEREKKHDVKDKFSLRTFRKFHLVPVHFYLFFFAEKIPALQRCIQGRESKFKRTE